MCVTEAKALPPKGGAGKDKVKADKKEKKQPEKKPEKKPAPKPEPEGTWSKWGGGARLLISRNKRDWLIVEKQEWQHS